MPKANSQKPSSIPGLPGSALAVSYIAIATLPLIVSASIATKHRGFWIELGGGLALCAAALLFMQFLSSGRFERISGGIGLDRTMGFHRMAALMLAGFAILHPLAYIAPGFADNPTAHLRHLRAMLLAPSLRTGVLALVGLLLLITIATARTRLRYEAWRVSHGALALIVAALVLAHAYRAGTYSQSPELRAVWTALVVAASAASVIAVLRSQLPKNRAWRLHSVESAGPGIWMLDLVTTGPTDFVFRGGQFVWLILGKPRLWFTDHPFSIASGPEQLPHLRLLVLESGDFTRTISRVSLGSEATLDGPHGSFVLREGGDNVLLIAGGVGIAPILGMLEEAASAHDHRKFRLLYAAKSSARCIMQQRLAELSEQLDLQVTYALDDPTDQPDARQGPINKAFIADLLDGLTLTHSQAYVCGPPPMMEFVTDVLLDAGVAANHIHYERFDFGAGHGRLDKRQRNMCIAVLALITLFVLAFAAR